MLNDKSGAFMASEIDVSQTGGNVNILHLEWDHSCTGVPSTKSLSVHQLSTSEDVRTLGVS